MPASCPLPMPCTLPVPRTLPTLDKSRLPRLHSIMVVVLGPYPNRSNPS